jgi:hypothetical protein
MLVLYIYVFKSRMMAKFMKDKNDLLKHFINKEYWNRNQITFYGKLVKLSL